MSRATRRVVSLAGLVAVAGLAASAPAAAIGPKEEIFLSDSCETRDGVSKLFRVVMNDPQARAELELLHYMPLDQVDALACTPDGGKCYALDKYHPVTNPLGGLYGVYDVIADKWTTLGEVKHKENGKLVKGVVLAAFDRKGRLLFASEHTDRMYQLDIATGEATEVGPVRARFPGTDHDTVDVLDLQGADFAFTATTRRREGCLWTNSQLHPSGLYRFVLPSTFPGTVEAWFAHADTHQEYFTGLAVRKNGQGMVIGSNCEDEIHTQMLNTGVDGPVCDMYEYGQPYDYIFGDMSNGFLGLPICRTAGFWKNRSGTEGGGNNITQAVIDAAGGSIEVCGQRITRGAPAGDLGSALEGLCVKVQGVQQRQLYRQLVAATLNCVLSGAADCAAVVPDYDDCNDLCAFGGGGGLSFSECRERIDCFNNGGHYRGGSCVPDDGGCHDLSLCESPDPALCFDPPGRTSSTAACGIAANNDCTIDGCASPTKSSRMKQRRPKSKKAGIERSR